MLPKAPNKYSINTVIKYYEHMIQGCHFNLTSVSENSILTILKTIQVSEAAGLDNLSGCFEKFPGLGKVAKLKPLYKKGSLTQPCSYRPISLLPLISKVIEKSHSRSNKYLCEFVKLIMHLPIWFSKKTFHRFLPFLFE